MIWRFAVLAGIFLAPSVAAADDEVGEVSPLSPSGHPYGFCEVWEDQNLNGRQDEGERVASPSPEKRPPDEVRHETRDGKKVRVEIWRRPATEDDILPPGVDVFEEQMLYVFNDDGRVVEEIYFSPEGASAGEDRKYRYDDAGRLVRVTEYVVKAAPTTDIEYGPLGRPTRIVSSFNVGAGKLHVSDTRLIFEGEELVRVASDDVDLEACGADGVACDESKKVGDGWHETSRESGAERVTFVRDSSGRIVKAYRVSQDSYSGTQASVTVYRYNCP